MRALLFATSVLVSACQKDPAPREREAASSAPSELVEGSMAPSFTAKTHRGETFDLDAQRGKTVIVYFYPKDETSGCTAEAEAFRDDFTALQEKGAVVVGISADSLESHAQFAEAHRLPFALLSDPEGSLAAKYGVPFTKVAKRQTFVVGKDGKLVKVFRDVQVAGHAAEIRAVL